MTQLVTSPHPLPHRERLHSVTSSVMAGRPGKNIASEPGSCPFKLATSGLNSACCPSSGAGDGTSMQQIAEWLEKLGMSEYAARFS